MQTCADLKYTRFPRSIRANRKHLIPQRADWHVPRQEGPFRFSCPKICKYAILRLCASGTYLERRRAPRGRVD